MSDRPTLYKRDITGKIRQWTITVEDKGTHAVYRQEHGVVDGAMISSETEIHEGKNLSKANETDYLEQCEKEANSLWNKQVSRKGYLDKKPHHTMIRFSPMLAKSYNEPGNDIKKLKDGHHIQFPAYFQPKLDGIRCIACKYHDGPNNPVGTLLRSRQDKLFTALPELEETIFNLPNLQFPLKLDGELYIHGDEFQDIVSAIKRDKPSKASSKIQYHVYDVHAGNNPNWAYEDRMKWLKNNIKPGFRRIKPVYTGIVTSMLDVERQLKIQTDRGYEGIMLRNKFGLYKVAGRSKDLQKVKLFIDEEFPIVGAYENKGKMKNQCTFECLTKAGVKFSVKPKGTEALREQYWEDWKKGKLKGKELTVRFFAWTTSKNKKPRFPVGLTIRDYE